MIRSVNAGRVERKFWPVSSRLGFTTVSNGVDIAIALRIAPQIGPSESQRSREWLSKSEDGSRTIRSMAPSERLRLGAAGLFFAFLTTAAIYVMQAFPQQ